MIMPPREVLNYSCNNCVFVCFQFAMSRLLEKPNIAMSIKSSSGSQLSSSAATAGNATALSVSASEVAVQSPTETITSPTAVISSSTNNNGEIDENRRQIS